MSLGRARRGGLRGVCGLALLAGIGFGHCFGQSPESPSLQSGREEDNLAWRLVAQDDGRGGVGEAAQNAVAPPPPAAQPVPRTEPAEWWDAPSVLRSVPNDPIWIQPRFTVRRDFGNGVGYQNGYTYVEGFIPTWQSPGDQLVFVNVRGVNYDAAGLWEGQLGAGIRQLTDLGVVFGANAFYDGRSTDTRFYNQVGLGWEALGSVWEARGNVYIPVGAQRSFGRTAGAAVNPQFVNQNIQIDRIINDQRQAAMNGCDVELGRQLPSLWDDVRTSAYVGYYHYSNHGMQSANGVRVRAESWFGENVSANLAYQNDAVFDTTVTGGISLHYGGVPNGRRQANPLAAKLGSRVVRDPNIVISTEKKTSTEQELLVDPSTGNPIVVVHADSAAAAGGDGSVENPYNTLAEVQAGSGVGNILFLHAGSTFTQPSLNLQDGQRLLGEGVDHFVTATQGTFLLPRATAFTDAPLLVRTSGATNAINLASDNEVSGLAYERTGGNGGFIAGTGDIGNFNINRNTTTGGLFAVGITNANGDGVISDNTFSAHTVNAVGLTLTTGALRLLIADNVFNGGTSGVNLTQTGGTHVFGIRDNQFTSAVSVSDTVIGGTQTLQLLDNTGTGGFSLSRVLGTFQVEDTLGTNTPARTTIGTIIIVPEGSAGF